MKGLMPRPLSLAFRQHVRAPPERVWSVVGDFGNEHRWARLIRSSQRDRPDVEIGTVRRCELAKPLMGRTHVEEELVAIEPGSALAYRLRGALGPFAEVENRWRIRADGEGTLVETQARLTPRHALVGIVLAPLVLAYLRYALRDAMREFATYVEAAHAEGEE